MNTIVRSSPPRQGLALQKVQRHGADLGVVHQLPLADR